jgi:hypothetical protein
MAKRDVITVKTTIPNRGSFLEQHEEHPGGQAWVRGEHEVEVAETPRVLSAIAAGRLTVVEKSRKGGSEALQAAEAAAEESDTANAETDAQTATDESTAASANDAVVRTQEPVANVVTDGSTGGKDSRRTTPKK